MTNKTKSLIYAAIVGLLIVTIFLGFLTSMTNPVSWILIVVLILLSTLYKKLKPDNRIQWKDEYSVGIDDIDKDHKKLINLLNQFNTAYDYAMSESYEREALNDLVDYTKYHFEREEALLKANNYPDYDAHKEQHRLMIEQVNGFVALYNAEGHKAMSEISEFLSSWLINHIQGSDKAYSAHLISCGVNK